MGESQRFHGIGNQLPRGEGILHAHVAHGDAVTHANGRDQQRGAARHSHAGFGGFRNFVEVNMAGNDFVKRRNHADQRAFHFFFGQSQRVHQRTMRGAFRAFENLISNSFCVSHDNLPFGFKYGVSFFQIGFST